MRVILTRPAERAEPLAARLRERGHDVVLCPLVRIEPLGAAPVDVDGYDWVVVTSATGAAELARRRRGSFRRLAAIGAATAAALAERGLRVDLVPRAATQEGLLAELPRPAGRVLFAGAEGARRLLVDELRADFVPLYRAVELRPASFPDGDLAVVTSGSGARALARVRRDLPVVVIGPQTSIAAEAAGLRVLAQAGAPDADALAEAVDAAAASLTRNERTPRP